MQLTKTFEKEILSNYDKWLHSYLNGDIETYDSYFDDAYHFIGSTNNEEFLTRKDTTNFFQKTADQFAGKTDLRNETQTIELFEKLVFITHAFDAWFLNGKEWAYYGRFRFSSVMQKKKKNWKFIYQHFSTTDSKTDEGETIGFDKVNLENQELREAIKRKTFELEEKNRELEVEGALERIRAQAVAMKESSDLLDIVVTMRNEFVKLGHEAHYFWHMMWLPETYQKAMTSGDGTKIGFVMELPRHIHGDIPLLAKWEKSKKATAVHAMNADEAIDYVDKMVMLGDFQNIDPQAPSDDDIRHIGGLTFIMARTSHGEIGYSLPGVVKNPPKEDLEILVKFAGAFDLAHRRFLDLQKAEKQRREVQIELALEKVRSRSLAMHKSEELNEVVSVLFKKLKELQIPATAVGIGIYIDDSKDLNAYVCGKNEGGLVITNYRLPYFNNKISREICNFQEKKLDFFVGHYSKAVKNSFYKYILKHTPEFKYLPEDIKSMIFNSPSYTITMVGVNHAIFNINDFEGKILSDDDIAIIKRFARVFDQSYTRFLDLQKAEAQARESEIELALERVRARTMAMQHSDELQEASFLLDQQVRILGIKTWGCAFNIYGEKESTEWFGNEAGVLPTYTVPRIGIFKKYYYKGQKGETLWIEEFSGKACVAHYETMSALPVIGAVLLQLKETNNGFPTYQIDHVVYFKYGYLLFITKEHVPESYDVFKRFAKVFEQTYTRFLDLQKAEAQVREAQIEAALERVRSKAMAMHSSEDLSQTVNAFFNELKTLGLSMRRCGVGILDVNTRIVDVHVTTETLTKDSKMMTGLLTLSGHPVLDEIFETFKRQEEYHPVLRGKQLSDYYKTINSEVKYPNFTDDDIQYGYYFHFKEGGVFTWTDKELTEADLQIFRRYTTVLSLTYRRYLDLKEAEAQAKESEIELALERVRARSMAMQKSDELKDVIKIVYQQLTHLKINLKHSGFVVDYKPKGDWHFWIADEQDIPSQISHPYFESVWGNQFNKAKDKGEHFFATNLNFKEKNKFYNELLSFIPDLPKVSKDFYLNCPGLAASTVLLDSIGLYIENFEGIPYTEEENSILMRFGKVFQQTYTRFLDLQKAEAQAKEAKIETALEKVRSRSLAMQNSEELKELIGTVYKELNNLDMSLDRCLIWIMNDEDFSTRLWMANRAAEPVSFYVPNHKNPPYRAFIKGWKERDTNWEYNLKGKVKKEWDTFVFEKTEMKHLPDELKKMMQASEQTVMSGSFHSFGCLQTANSEGLSEEQSSILTRFAKVFNQAYTRFSDLKKAEAQAREAEIELALERVRSRSMAMQKSSELLEAAELLWTEITKLGIESITSGFVLMEEDEKIGWNYMPNPSTGKILPEAIGVYHDKTDIMRNITQNWKKQKPLFIVEMNEKQTITHQTFIAEQSINFHITAKQLIAVSPPRLKLHNFNFKQGYLLIVGGTRLTSEQEEIMLRFTNVFQQTYTRFLDLQKAEAQTREAKIEMALEKVRSRTMAMQHSKELPDAANVLFTEVQNLGIPAWSCGYNILSEDKKSSNCIMSSEGEIQSPFILPLTEHKSLKPWHKTILKNEAFFVYEQGGNDLVEHYNYMESLPELKETFQQFKDSDIPLPTFQVNHLAKFTNGFLLFITYERVSEAHDIFKRFAKVFEQTYTRFLDLQRAEAQAREAQIETALEKVRSRSMAMHTSEELLDVITVVSEQLKHLEFKFVHVSFANNDIDGDYKFWTSSPGRPKPMRFNVPYLDIAVFNNLRNAQKKSLSFYTDVLTKKEHNQWHKHLLKHGGSDVFSKVDNEFIMSRGMARSIAINPNIMLILANYASIPYSEADNKIIERFGQVFEQSYTRFLDLQKAEAQAREAQVEGALERVRSKTMAMYNSNNLEDIVISLFDEVLKLGLDKTIRCGIGILEDHEGMETRSVNSNPDGTVELRVGMLNMTIHPMLVGLKKAWKNGSKGYSYEYIGKDVRTYYEALNNEPEYPFNANLAQLPKREFHRSFFFSSGIIFTFSENQISEESSLILARFAAVFGQTYRRFLDLKKAEAQTREAQISLAVERVRAKALAMHKSEEIMNVVAKLKDEVMSLDIPDVVAATIFLNEGDDKVRMWDLSTLDINDKNGYEAPFDITFKLKKTDPHLYVKRVWENTDDYFIEIQNEKDFKRIIAWLRENNQFKVANEVEDYTESTQLKQLYHAVKKLNNGKLVIDLMNPPSEEMENILTKMGAAFDLAYKRFEDLQKAEAQTREALIEASLERVRSRTLAMQNSEELAQTSVVVFQQLLELGIAPNRLFIGIVKEKDNKIEAWATNEDGSKLAKHFTLEAAKNKSIKKMLEGWKQQHKSLVIDLKGKELQSYFQYLNEDIDIPFIHGLEQKRRVQTIAYFSGGLIGMAAPEEQPDDTIKLLERFAAVFNLTYTRFNDLKIAEAQTKKAEEDLLNLQAAKKSAEDALSELQTTQTQLIQSEKMASLGELTAGIAHEIQNPLNFVNNFSEVSKELLNEMLEEIENGDMDEVRAIMVDVIMNLEKINHHGKRADGIVKGMLQHSRASGNKKEPTDINTLADEYLRLAYHGLRAKDKSFNSELVTDFDATIKTINIIPQDIGRVILNLLTNAFYVVDEKKKSGLKDYDPTVAISTKKNKNNIVIVVKDNGNGMPEAVKDKIFQPFFTTKPTGQGTGLGLSMSYDIVTKGHGGELSVDTKEGEGTTFIIQLPL